MTFLKIDNLSSNYFINFLIILLPVSFIAGNLIINLNLMLIIIFSLLFYGKEIFQIKLFFFDKLLVFVFAFCIFTSIANTYLFQDNTPNNIDTLTIKKTFSFLRFFFLFCFKIFSWKKNFQFQIFFYIGSCLLYFCINWLDLPIH